MSRMQMAKSFKRSESGSITLFIVLMFTIMVLGSGMAIDFMRYESERASLQDAIDRGVLSAASLRRTGGHAEAEAIVNSYLKSNSIGLKSVDTAITTDLAMNSRRVNIAADYTINTIFLKLAGITTLTVNAQASAQEARNDIEISMVLDVTGSMAPPWSTLDEHGRSRLDNLKIAAKAFVDLMLADESVDRTTISIVPFATRVRVPDYLANQYLESEVATDVCFLFVDGAYEYRKLDSSTIRGVNSRSCASGVGDYAEILPLSNSKVVLRDKLDSLRTGGSTDTAYGLKWGVALLDPLTQPVISNLTAMVDDAETGTFKVNPAFADRPALYTNTDTLKFVILMTDGDNTARGTGDSLTADLCDAAKVDDKIVIYTIAYQVSEGSRAEALMMGCASGPSKFYGAADMDIETTFRQIAQSIQKLRLVN